MLKLFGFRYWIGGALVWIALVSFVAYKQHSAAEEYKHHRAEYCAALGSASAEQKKSCIEERASAQDYLPWGYELFRWPDGITTWAIIATGFVIGWQAWETRKAAEAGLRQANHLIASERGWVMVEAKLEQGAGLAWGGDDTNASVELSILNAGPTPAWVYEQYATSKFPLWS
jgi:hypothetical protein